MMLFTGWPRVPEIFVAQEEIGMLWLDVSVELVIIDVTSRGKRIENTLTGHHAKCLK